MPRGRKLPEPQRPRRLTPEAGDAGCMVFGSTPAPKPARKVATVNEESRAKAARHLSRLRCKASAQESHPSNGFYFFVCKASAEERRPPPRQKASWTGKPSARFPTDLGGLVPIASEPIRRLGFASPPRRNPRRTRSEYHRGEKCPAKSGTSYFAQNRNFSFCADTPNSQG